MSLSSSHSQINYFNNLKVSNQLEKKLAWNSSAICILLANEYSILSICCWTNFFVVSHILFIHTYTSADHSTLHSHKCVRFFQILQNEIHIDFHRIWYHAFQTLHLRFRASLLSSTQFLTKLVYTFEWLCKNTIYSFEKLHAPACNKVINWQCVILTS